MIAAVTWSFFADARSGFARAEASISAAARRFAFDGYFRQAARRLRPPFWAAPPRSLEANSVCIPWLDGRRDATFSTRLVDGSLRLSVGGETWILPEAEAVEFSWIRDDGGSLIGLRAEGRSSGCAFLVEAPFGSAWLSVGDTP